MARVTVEEGKFERAMKQFKRKVANSGLISEVKSRVYFEKPAEVRKRKKAAAVARTRKKAKQNLQRKY